MAQTNDVDAVIQQAMEHVALDGAIMLYGRLAPTELVQVCGRWQSKPTFSQPSNVIGFTLQRCCPSPATCLTLGHKLH